MVASAADVTQKARRGVVMANERLRSALLENGVTPNALAEVLDVDPKSVERWVSGRTPYRRHRYAVAAHLGVDEAYIWPESLTPGQIASASESEIVNIYPHRWAVPSEMWRHIFDAAETDIGVLVYSGLFLSEDTGRVIRNSIRRSRGRWLRGRSRGTC